MTADDGGYDIEHFRDFNNAGPDVRFGFEGAPGLSTVAPFSILRASRAVHSRSAGSPVV